MPLPIQSVNHVACMTKRLDESRAFYRDVLGFEEVERPNFNFAGSWLYNYGIMIHLIYNEAAPDPTGEIQTRNDHLALHTDDLQLVEQLLNEHKIPFRRNRVPDRGISQVFFRDPDGHHIEVGTYPDMPKYM